MEARRDPIGQLIRVAAMVRWAGVVGGFVMAAAIGAANLAHGGSASVKWEPVAFSGLPGWAGDDHAEALRAFRQSCGQPPGTGPAHIVAALAKICASALAVPASALSDRAKATAFFEANFQASRVAGDGSGGLLTGYFEPELEGSIHKDQRFRVPVLRRPDDLVDVVPANERAAANAAGKLASMRKTKDGLVPYFTRAEIDAGALAGQGLELVYLDNATDAYLMHVQGSGSIRLRDGHTMRIGYNGKNGYPFTSAGSVLIREGVIKRENLTMQTMRAWLDSHPKRARRILEENRSYIFFEEKALAQGATGPIGGHGTPLTPGRSLAVDPEYHVLGAPVFVVADGLTSGGASSFRHLMIAEDVGSAIKGPERGDIFWGTGSAAGEIAGRTKHRGSIYALLPRGVGGP